MGITANHIISDIINIASSNSNSDDFKISKEQVLFWIEETRSILISQALAKKDDINDSWIQYIDCLSLQLADQSECCEVSSGCKLLRSTEPLPGTIDTYKDNWIVYVKTPLGDIVPKGNFFKNRYQKYNKYTSGDFSWYIRNNFLYVVNDIFLEYVSIAGLFEFPSDLSEISSCQSNSCWSFDSNYPITATMSTQITDIILKTKIYPMMNYSEDTSNNASGVTPQQAVNNKKE